MKQPTLLKAGTILFFISMIGAFVAYRSDAFKDPPPSRAAHETADPVDADDSMLLPDAEPVPQSPAPHEHEVAHGSKATPVPSKEIMSGSKSLILKETIPAIPEPAVVNADSFHLDEVLKSSKSAIVFDSTDVESFRPDAIFFGSKSAPVMTNKPDTSVLNCLKKKINK